MRRHTLAVSAARDVALVIGTSGARAIRAGVDALNEGGSAADAAMVAALSQVALAAGAWVSYAGIMSMMYFDAHTGRIHSLNAAFDVPRGETEPLSIPGSGVASGRTALVPGFMAGVQAAHDRFGALPFARLFEPAIRISERGFRIDRTLHRMFRLREAELRRTPEGRALFVRRDGRLYGEGDRFRQPALAATLRDVSTSGADYMYRGAWGRRLIEVVAREGGRLSLRDLARYRARWVRPVRGTYHDYVVHGPGLPGLGGVHAIEALNVLEAAGLTLDEERASSLALYWLMRITQVAYRRARTADSSRSDKARARDVWRRIRERTSSAASPSRQRHSDAVVAVDADGNVAALCHSINTIAWGTTALFVDGVSIPDSACFQQRLMRQVGPGARLPDPMNPLIVARDGRPVLATSSIGSSLHEVTIQSLVNILDRGMEPRDAVLAPQFMSPVWTTRRWKRGEAPARASAPRKRCAPKRPTRTLVPAQTVEPGNFSTRLLRGVRARGQAVYLANDNPLLGYWAGIQIDPDTGALLGAVTSRRRESAAAAHGY